MEMDLLDAIVGGLGIFMFVVFAACIALYIFESLGIKYVLEKSDFSPSWFAWIPGLSLFALSYCAKDEEENVNFFGLKIPAFVFALWIALYYVFSFSVGGALVAYILQILCMGRTLQIIYARLEGKDERDVKALAYASAFIAIIRIVKFWQYRKRQA